MPALPAGPYGVPDINREQGDAMAGMAVQPSLRIPRNPLRAVTSSALWLASVHLLGDAAVAVALGLPVLLLVVASAVLGPWFLLGLPVWVWTIRFVCRAAHWERRRVATGLGPVITPLPLPEPSGRVLRDAWAFARSTAVWRHLCYFAVLPLLAVVSVSGVLLAWSLPLALAALPLTWPAYPAGFAQVGPWRVDDATSATTFAVLALTFLLLVSPALIRALAALDVAVARALLGRSAETELTQRVDELVLSRQRVVDSVELERRRIERDLHDGAQQQLVSLSMTLGRLADRLDNRDDEAARRLVAASQQEAAAAIAELRRLTRGLHPPVLSDRGLDAALSAVAARAPVPVDVSVEVEPRPSLTVESIVYFVVTEALTNVAKHAAATRASVVIRRRADDLEVVITDDGRGGADPLLGTGLSGLADRVAGVDGRLSILSPAGGPTVLTVEVPCAS